MHHIVRRHCCARRVLTVSLLCWWLRGTHGNIHCWGRWGVDLRYGGEHGALGRASSWLSGAVQPLGMRRRYVVNAEALLADAPLVALYKCNAGCVWRANVLVPPLFFCGWLQCAGLY